MTSDHACLPLCRVEAVARGWDEVDVVLVSGDAYVDHPSFGTALIGRFLESKGLRVGIIAQPDWRSPADFAEYGKPRLFCGITAGAMDSMVSNYTTAGKRRKYDSYAPGGKFGLRPDRAVIVYANRLRELFGSSVPIIAGGIEASLRRLAHYDFWDHKVRRSILFDARIDLLVYGFGERALSEIVRRALAGGYGNYFDNIPGTATVAAESPPEALILPSYEAVSESQDAFNEAFRMADGENNPICGKVLAQAHGNRWAVVQSPAKPLSSAEMDQVYSLPFTRQAHPAYEEAGGVPALSEVLFSITAHRGCLGNCSFCTLAAHQGRVIQPRTDESIIREATSFTKDPRFKGIIHDVGGPSANFHEPACAEQESRGPCKNRTCMFPEPCRHLNRSQAGFTALLRRLRDIPGVRHVFVRSGIRHDMAVLEENREFLKQLTEHHVSGQLKVAPEHVDNRVLRLMGKPPFEVYLDFADEFSQLSQAAGKKQYLVPYFISGHPGADLNAAIKMAEFIKGQGRFFEQVQDFIPLPMTRSACQWYTGKDPFTGEEVYVPSDPKEKAMHRALMQFQAPENWKLVKEALEISGRKDLIGAGPHCLISEKQPCVRHKRKVVSGGRKSPARHE
ncbi:MAG TPA: YgiQ family radical SAM protein [Firmicutes bacterium]|nr:YgiQ family radical SAM protein [Bacillota bacterium]